MFVPVSWSVDVTPATIISWRVYAAEDEGSKGVLVAEVDAAERMTEIQVGEGTYYVRVLGLYRDGTEPAWEGVQPRRLDVSGQEAAPAEPTEPAIAVVDPTSARVEASPPAHEDGEGTRLQVLEMPPGETDPGLGVVVAEQVETIGGPLAPRGVRQPGPLVALGAGGDTLPSTRRLGVRRVTPFGAVSDPQFVDVPVVDRPGHYTVVVASVSGATLVGWASPASSDPWETDATDGVRLKHLPVVDSWDTDYGYPDDWGSDSSDPADGVLRGNQFFGAYADFARLALSATKDFGATVDFVLEAWFPVTRTTPEGCVEDEVVDNWDFPVDPMGATRDLVDVDIRTRVSGPLGFFREAFLDGTSPPLTRDAARLYYVVGTSLPLPTDRASWVPWTPDAVIRGRYLDLYLELREPTGMHQLSMPKCVVNARVLMRRTVSSGAPSHAAPPGSIHVDESGQKVYFKTTGVGTSGHTEMATKAQLDAAVLGMDWKGSVRVATTTALAANTRTGNVLEANANGSLGGIDGVTMSVGDRVLVKNEATGANNGLYTVTSLGSAGSKWSLTRATDADADADVTAGMAVAVAEGTTNADTIWVLTTNDPITINTTALSFSQLGGGGAPAAHASSHQDGGSDEVGTGTPAAGAIPKADGSGVLDPGWIPPGRLVNRQILTGTGTFTKGSATTAILFRAVAPGGGGGGAGNGAGTAGAGGGGSGENGDLYVTSPASSYAYDCGSAGTAGANTGGNGGDGGDLEVDIGGGGANVLTLKGGKGGTGQASTTTAGLVAGGAGGTGGSGGNRNPGSPGQPGGRLAAAINVGGSGGPSRFGGGGLGLVAAAAGNDGGAYGAGGSGASASGATGRAGGAGVAGAIEVFEFE